MKARKPKNLRELSNEELITQCKESIDTLAQQRFQNQLKQLQDVAYLRILKADIARMKTILNERKITLN
jgi:large subunit ribosomal protein L29